MALYTDPVLSTLITALNADGPVKLRNKYFVGDPVIVNAASLPMCFVSRDTTTISIDTNMSDAHVMPIVLNVVYAGAAELNQKSFSTAGSLALYELCEGRGTDYGLRADSIAAVLRSHQVLDGNNKLYIDIEGADTTIEYILSPPARRGIFSVEAIIRTQLKQLQLRP